MRDDHTNIKDITALFFELERNHDLLNLEIKGVLVWQSARVAIYMTLLDMIIPHNNRWTQVAIVTRLKTFYKRIIINSLLYNPFLDFMKSDVLIFESGRRYLVDNKHIDIYTKYFCDELKNANILHTTYCTNFLFDDLAPHSFAVKHIDFINIASKLLTKFINISLSDIDIKKIKAIENAVNSSLSVCIDLETIFINEIKRFKAQYFFFNRLFKLKKSKSVYLISSSEKAPLIKAAKDNNMIVNELQHGLITKDGIVNNFPHAMEDSLEYFPNNFFVWDDLDMCTAKLPLSKKHIIPFKNKHLQYMLQQHQKTPRKENQILIISQPYGSKEILQFIVGNIAEMNQWEFVYKLHPAENHDYLTQELFQLLTKFRNLKMVNNDKSIYALFAESKYVIGVFSTALFEASHFGCQVLLLNLPGVENVSVLIEKQKARLIETSDRLKDYL